MSILEQEADPNQYEPFLKQYADYTSYLPLDYRVFGKYSWIQLAQHNKRKFTKALLDIQDIILPTFSQLRNKKNMKQLQERIYQPMKRYEQKFNKCHKAARTLNQADYCADQLVKDLTVNFRPQLESILKQY